MRLKTSVFTAGLGLLLAGGAPAIAGDPLVPVPCPTVAAPSWTLWLPGPGTASTLGTDPRHPLPGDASPAFPEVPAEPPVAVVEPLKLAEDKGGKVLMYPGRMVATERALAAQARHLRASQGGAFIGVGSMPSLLLLGMQWRERGILMDYDRDVVRLNRVLLDLVRTLSEAPPPGIRPELQRYQFISILCMADVPMAVLERVADQTGTPQLRARALFEQIRRAPVLVPAAAPEHLRPVVESLMRVYEQATVRGGPAEAIRGIENQARKTWPGTPSFETYRREQVRRFAALVMKADWSHYFRNLICAADDAEHFFPYSDSAWQRLADMHGEGRIQVMQGDLARGGGALAALGQTLRVAGVPVAVLYGSNAVQHFGTNPASLRHFQENLDSLPWGDQPRVLLAGTPSLLPTLLTPSQQQIADHGGNVFTYHALRPAEVRRAVQEGR